MKRQKLKLILITLMGVIALVLIFQNRTGTLKKEIGEFAIDDTASVTKIYMADMRGNEVLITRNSPFDWMVNDSLKARTDAVKMLLSTMYRLAVQSPVSKSGYNNVISNLAGNSVKVEVYQYLPRISFFGSNFFYRERLTKVYYVGQPTSDNLGTYMLMEGSDTPFIVYLPGLRGFVSARFSANPGDWRDHTIFAKNPHEISAIQVEFPLNSEESFRIEKSGRDNVILRKLKDNQRIEQFDADRIAGFINGYKNIRFESLIEKSAPLNVDSILLSIPLHVITLTDTSGNIQVVKTFRRKNYDLMLDDDDNFYPFDMDRLYALINNGSDFVLIQYFVFDPITRPLSYFLREEN